MIVHCYTIEVRVEDKVSVLKVNIGSEIRSSREEIHIPIPPDATPAQRTKLEDKAKEIYDRLEGDYDHYWLKQLFLEYKITEEDADRAQKEAEDILKRLTEEAADFTQIAQAESDHSDTRYDGGDMGFLARGEKDKEGELLLDPILEEAAFALKEGEVSTILRTESAFHILKVERVLEIYGEREIRLSRIDIAIEASEATSTDSSRDS